MYIIWIYTCNHRVYLRCFLHLTFYFFYSLSQSLKVMSRLMRECWYHNPAARLTTLRIKKSLDNLAKAEDMKFWFVIKRCSKQSKLMNYHPFLFRSVHVEHVWMMWAFRIFLFAMNCWQAGICDISVFGSACSESVRLCMYMHQNVVWYEICHRAKHVYNWLLFYSIFCTCHRAKKKCIHLIVILLYFLNFF